MILLVGLGNPGKEYANNRHNVGFMVIDQVVQRYRFGAYQNKHQGQLAQGRIDEQTVFALKPQTHMNLSGRSLEAAARFYKISPEKIFVIHDELDLCLGKIKLKQGGGNGGHRGLRDLDRHIGNNYHRLRIGIGHPGDKELVIKHVLSDFSKNDFLWLTPIIEAITIHIGLALAGEKSEFIAQVLSSVKAKPKASLS